MDNRFRKLPPRIEPLYETQDVSDPPPLPEVQQTSWLSPAGTVAGYEQLADAFAHQPAQHRWRRRVLVALFATLLLGALVAGLFSEIRT
ncbi:hypothetical protein ACFQFC_17675 [Amorphoplanes digitatis]|uniref:Uncharacterized protein n=1 Tax=Actinoplanes digitatis TaxID=1868 RepID=A0A7W7I3Z4_9ACTN|nr:hypothetical protein [Actinoplanes digitatis]MBB4766044.1 hypothetical protein [Actinoplanes digitatis]GID98553.1 hypothetical protein Adi01nite_79650 [Actinoplanes digitatis]